MSRSSILRRNMYSDLGQIIVILGEEVGAYKWENFPNYFPDPGDSRQQVLQQELSSQQDKWAIPG